MNKNFLRVNVWLGSILVCLLVAKTPGNAGNDPRNQCKWGTDLTGAPKSVRPRPTQSQQPIDQQKLAVRNKTRRIFNEPRLVKVKVLIHQGDMFGGVYEDCVVPRYNNFKHQ